MCSSCWRHNESKQLAVCIFFSFHLFGVFFGSLYPPNTHIPSSRLPPPPPKKKGKKEKKKIQIQQIRTVGRVRCTINRPHSTPCKKAEFEHLQIFPGHCLDFSLPVSGKICHSPIKKSEKTTYLDNLVFSPFSVL